jgi:hypothetical protein
MTVIVGILCSDGVVIGTDSAIATGRLSTGYTIERQDEAALKIEIIGTDVITAVTGATGLAQRFNDQIDVTIKQLRQPFQPPAQFIPGFGFIGGKIQNTFAGKLEAGLIPYNVIKPVEIGRVISEAITDDFKRTQSTFQLQNGWGLGALFAFVHNEGL